MTNDLRILGVDPGTRHMGVAVLDGGQLLYYGVKDFKRKRPADELLRATRQALLDLIDTYHPAIFAYEKTFYVQSKSSALLHVQEMEIARIAKTSALRPFGYSPAYVRKVVCRDGRATKHAVADVLANRFPELTGYRHRHEPLLEQYWLNMFDAVAVALACGASIGRDSGPGTDLPHVA